MLKLPGYNVVWVDFKNKCVDEFKTQDEMYKSLYKDWCGMDNYFDDDDGDFDEDF